MGPESFPISGEFDKPREKCGVFGIASNRYDAARIINTGLNHLQHRGQDAAGIVVWNGFTLEAGGNVGLVREIFDDETLAELSGGSIGIGWTRYATAGSESTPDDYLPLVRQIQRHNYGFGLSHNGNLNEIFGEAINGNSQTSDTEMLVDKLQEDIELHGESVYEALKRVLPRVEGAYSLVVMDKDQLIGVRDPNGFRPLLLGVTDKLEWCFSSESGALKKVGVSTRDIQEVQPGQIVVIKNGVRHNDSIEVEPRDETFCINEFVYFSREDQTLKGESVQTRRMRMGYELAEEFPIYADVVMGVPGTAIPIATGYSSRTAIPHEQGIIKHGNRTFIQPDQQTRQAEAEIKFSVVPDIIKGRKIIVIDDSIVRGTVTKTLMDMLFEEGAKEVHVLIASPPHKHGCYYGLDTSRENRLIASGKTIEEIRQHIGADSLNYLSLERLKKAVSSESDYFCDACFTGNYPPPIPVQIGHVAAQVSR